MTIVKVCNADDFPDDIVTRSRTILPEKMLEEIFRYKYFKDQKVRIISRMLLLDSILESGYNPGLLHSFERDEKNKPFIKDWLHFNISHSGKMIALAYSDKKTGVDIEEIKTIDIDLFQNHLHRKELEQIQGAADALSAFYNIWSRKEAILKADGIGIIYEIDTLNSVSTPVSLHGIDYDLVPLNLPDTYVGFVACPCEPSSTAVISQSRVRQLLHL